MTHDESEISPVRAARLQQKARRKSNGLQKVWWFFVGMPPAETLAERFEAGELKGSGGDASGMSSELDEIPTVRDYDVHFRPVDAGVALEALGKYVQEAAEDNRGDDARRACEVAARVGSDMESGMHHVGRHE
ncbi:hypothetical protein [Haloarcula sp. Atlit-7R]|uniref:hypothetical protein n=1 Tax=Haloarcula sp. Atlit-7R TaxID=2282125 RepID=UPI000EF14460|nr:hypothetical protein [Haloarcula sp. Atlit-7R]RLM87895.1 hypothetical protein D3D01_22260 [Haloarcula sp. Atlit-7R]